MLTILSFFLGPIGRWIIISVLGVGLMSWITGTAKAPYEARVTELETAIKQRDQNAERDRKLAEDQTTTAERRDADLGMVVAASGKGACSFTDAELKQLQQLANARSGQLKMRAPAR